MPSAADFRGDPPGGIFLTSIRCVVSASVIGISGSPANLSYPEVENSPVSERITYITDDTFEAEVLRAEQPVLVDYWAEWCSPCRMIAPILDEIAVEYAGRVKVCKLNVDENQNTPPKYGIRGIPTLMLFRNGNVDATKVGALSKSQLAAFLDSSLG